MKARKSVNARITCGGKGPKMAAVKLYRRVTLDELEAGGLTTWRWRSFSVLWLYQGSSRSGDHCQAYFRTVLITALLIRMNRYTMRKAFIDLQGQRNKQEMEQLLTTILNKTLIYIILNIFYFSTAERFWDLDW